MSGYKKHILFGTILALLVYIILIYTKYIHFYISNLLTITLVSILYSILPDIDIRTSKAYQLFIFVAMVLILYTLYLNKLMYTSIIVLTVVAVSLLKHRGITHRWWFGVLISLPLLLNDTSTFLCGLTAYMSHLLLDTF